MSQILVPVQIERNARRQPDAVALQCGDVKRSWSQFDDRTRRIAAALGNLGSGPGARVAILAGSTIDYIEVLLGIVRSGASAVPLPATATPQSLAQMLMDSHARTIFVSRDLQPVVQEALERTTCIAPERRIGIDFSDRRWHALSDLLAQTSAKNGLPGIQPAQEFNLIYTSGTTGTPKGIVHSHQTRSAQMAAAAMIGLGRRSVTLISTTLYSNWTIFGLLASLFGGGKTLLLPRFRTERFLELIRDEDVTHAFLVPAQISRALADPDFDQYVEGHATLKLTAGSPLSASLKRELLNRWSGGLVENYGLTEGAPTTLLFAHLHPEKLDSVGVVTPGGELKIINEAGRELPAGETGEVVGRTLAMMDGYFNRDDLTAELEWFDDAGRRFFRSGDLGKLDSDGFLYLMGRKKDVIISGGMNIYACDIEDVVLAHPQVAECAVIGIPSPAWGETPLALVVPRKNANIDCATLRDWVNERLGKTQRVAAVEFRKALPRGALDKVLKNELRKPYWSDGIDDTAH